jgi:tRNA nucleotidyltransferase/poly(A) polymerase
MSSPRRIDASWLREGDLPRLLGVLDREGEEARVVGGAVRNTLLGEPVGDIDVATTALPDEVMRRAAAAGFRPVPTGVDHGTVTVVVDRTPFEVTTLREDVETFGRHARVAFGRDWRRDAERRDFTMNALYAGRDGTIYNHVGGLADLEQRRVRFIGDPATRIAEDYLRILRFFRFHAAYGEPGPPDPAGLSACIAARTGLETLSRERVRMEMLKLLVAKHAVPALVSMSEAGLLVAVLGGVPLLASFANMVKLEHELALVADPVRRLGALSVSTTEDAERLRERLRLANTEYERLASMADGWWHISAATGMQDARALIYRIGAGEFRDRALLAWSRAWNEGVADARWHDLVLLPDRWTAPVFPLKAADFLARGIVKGPALGAALRAAEETWIAQDFPMDATVLDRIAGAAVA